MQRKGSKEQTILPPLDVLEFFSVFSVLSVVKFFLLEIRYTEKIQDS
jgi:hypothetical protein